MKKHLPQQQMVNYDQCISDRIFALTICELMSEIMCFDSLYLIKNNWKESACIVQLIKYYHFVKSMGNNFHLQLSDIGDI
jgi:hypothetical protein